jgi:hypothetical protein
MQATKPLPMRRRNRHRRQSIPALTAPPLRVRLRTADRQQPVSMRAHQGYAGDPDLPMSEWVSPARYAARRGRAGI